MAGSVAGRPTFRCVIAARESPSKGATALTIRVNVAWPGNAEAEFHVQCTGNANDFAVELDDFEDGFLGGDYLSGGHQSGSVDTDDAHTGTRAAKFGPIGTNEVT